MPELPLVALDHEPEVGAVINLTEDKSVKVVRNLTHTEAEAGAPVFFRTMMANLPAGTVVFFAQYEKVLH